MKKVAVIGSGTSATLTVLHYLRWTDSEIDWYREDKETFSLIQSTNLVIPKLLWLTAGFGYEDLTNINGTVKLGTYKQNWGPEGSSFNDDYLASLVSYHFDDKDFQKYILKNVISKNNKVNIIRQTIDPENTDADHVMVCTGTPEDMSGYQESEFIPVNSAYVVRCHWGEVTSFNRSFNIARPHGWVYGNPNSNRCDVGYVYNDTITSLEDIKKDIFEVFCEFGLMPTEVTKVFPFKNYRKINNFGKRIVHNGRASFFMDPMEGTSTSFVGNINAYAFELWSNDTHTAETMQNEYNTFLDRIENFIMLYYYAGSAFDTPFWTMAKEKGNACMDRAMKETAFMQCIYEANQFINESKHISMTKSSMVGEYAYFWHGAFYNAVKHLGVYPELIKKIES